MSPATAHFIPMKIHYLGAARTTTGSMYLIEVNGKKLLLECGLFQGHREEMTNRNCCFPFDPKTIDAVVLSHAHMDHAGNLPNLVKQGYTGNIHCTFATRDLCSIMLVDSGHIQEADALFVSKQRAKKHLPPVPPLYTIADAENGMEKTVANLMTEGPSDAELSAARQLLRVELAKERDTATIRGIPRAAVVSDNERILGTLEAVRRDDVAAAARTLFAKDHRVVVTGG